MFLTRAEILEAQDLNVEELEIPEWNGRVRLRPLSGEERDRFETQMVGAKRKMNTDNVRARLAVLCMVDENNELLFTANDIAMLGRKSAKALDRIFDKALHMNGMTNEDVEDLAKNSGSAPSEDSGSS